MYNVKNFRDQTNNGYFHVSTLIIQYAEMDTSLIIMTSN